MIFKINAMRNVFMFLFVMFVAVNLHAQINYQTGSAVYNIPIFNYTDPKSGLSHSVALGYNSGQGIKVNQLASNVGLGWSVSSPGEIIRVQHGAPDDQYNPDVTVNNLSASAANDLIFEQNNASLYSKYYPNGFLYKRFGMDINPKQISFQPRFDLSENNNYKMAPAADEDTEQDEFLLNVNGITKSFVIGKNFEVRTTDQSKLKVTLIKEDTNDHTLYNQNILTKIKGFVVVDENGIEYTFDKYDLSGITEEKRRDPAVSGFYVNGKPRTNDGDKKQWLTGKYAINRWVITSIKEPVTQRKILVEYKTEYWYYITDFFISYSNIPGNNPASMGTMVGYSGTYTLVPLRIIYPDDVYVQYLYKPYFRTDLQGSAALDYIEIDAKNSFLKKVQFETGYFFGKNIIPDNAEAPGDPNSVSNNKDLMKSLYAKRLALSKLHVWNSNVSDERVYTFSYYTGDDSPDAGNAVPSRLDMHRDITGLYNKSMDISQPDYNGFNNTGTAESVLGCLKSVVAPGKNKLEYTYKQTWISNFPKSPVLVTKIVTSDDVMNTSYTKYYSYQVGITETNIAQGICYSGDNYSISRNYDITSVKDDSRFRLGNLTTWTPSNPVIQMLQSFIMPQVEGMVVNYLATILDANPVWAIAAHIGLQYFSNVIFSFFDDLFGGSGDVTYTITTSSGHLLSDPNALPTSLTSVNEYDEIGGVKYLAKQTRFRYINSGMYAYGFPYASKQRVDPGKLGDIVGVYVFNRNKDIVAQSEYEYDFSKEVLDDNFRSVKYAANHQYSAPYAQTPYLDGRIADGWISKESYNYMTGRSYVRKVTEQTSNLSYTQKAETAKEYTYNIKNNQVSQSFSVGSDNRVRGASIFYAIDFWDTYTSNIVLQRLKTTNMLNVPCATIQWYKDNASASTCYVTGVSVVEYDMNALKIASSKVYRIAQPIAVPVTSVNTFDPFAIPGWLSTYAYDVSVTNVYSGNLLVEAWANNNTSVASTKYDYNTWLPQATISNAPFNSVHYTSFESNNNDGWQYNAGGIEIYTNSATGLKAYHLADANNTITCAGLNTADQYRVTLWAKDNNVTVNGQSATVLGTVNGWKILQFQLSGASSVNITGNTYIDELRCLPVNARISTVCYHPIYTYKISECDASNRAVYYEYDTWGRIEIIRDENKNIIKTFDYKTQK